MSTLELYLLMQFLSTPSARRATPPQFPLLLLFFDFYPRPLRGGRLPISADSEALKYFYPRPLRGGRPLVPVFRLLRLLFLSTPSARRATFASSKVPLCSSFLSTPSARRATDTLLMSAYNSLFLSTPSARRATSLLATASFCCSFLSTPSARRATAKTETKSLFSNKLYNILHEFRRALIYNGSKSYPNHAK